MQNRVLFISFSIILNLSILLLTGCSSSVRFSDSKSSASAKTGTSNTGKSKVESKNNTLSNETAEIEVYQSGYASYYGAGFDGKKTASGSIFDKNQLTAAHLTLPFGTMVIVTNVKNGLSVVVEITDRGPNVAGRIIDLSEAAAREIEMIRDGVVPVEIRVIE